MLARSSPCHLLTARRTAVQNTRNCRLSCGFVPGTEQVVPLVVAHRPVEVLARSVDAGKRLLVQQARQAVLRRRPPHRLHRHHLMIGGEVRVLEHRRDFILARRHLVVPRLDRHADLVELGLDVRHERHRAVGNRAEVLILQLLSLRRLGAEQRAARVDEIGTRQVEVLVDQEIFLLGPAGRDDARRRSSRTASGRGPPASRALPSSAAAASSCRAFRRSS